MTWRRYVSLIALRATDMEAFACDFLEARGFVFLVDFGIKNAIDKAIEEFSREWDQRLWPK